MRRMNLPRARVRLPNHPSHHCCYYFTNTNQMKRDHPYSILGLQWGGGATLTDIQAAYRRKSLELHQDRRPGHNPTVAAREFAQLQKAYETLTQVHSNMNGGGSPEKDDGWHVIVWRNGDRIAVNRTNMPGVQKKRPSPSAAAAKQQQQFLLGQRSTWEMAVAIRLVVMLRQCWSGSQQVGPTQ